MDRAWLKTRGRASDLDHPGPLRRDFLLRLGNLLLGRELHLGIGASRRQLLLQFGGDEIPLGNIRIARGMRVAGEEQKLSLIRIEEFLPQALNLQSYQRSQSPET